MTGYVPDKTAALINYSQNFLAYYKSIISDIFYGSYYEQIFCPNCKNNLFNFHPYIYGLYHLDQVYNHKQMTIQCGNNSLYINNESNLSEINIYDCLYFDQQEKLNPQICTSCFVNFHFKNIIFTTPNIIIFIFLKNFLNSTIKFKIEEEININKYYKFIESEELSNNYNLIGMIFNNSQNEFFAYCKKPQDTEWHIFFDELVAKDKIFSKICRDNAIPYMLFYQRKDNK